MGLVKSGPGVGVGEVISFLKLTRWRRKALTKGRRRMLNPLPRCFISIGLNKAI